MTGNKHLLTELRSSNLDSITFGDSVKGRVLGFGLLNISGMPILRDVLLVEGNLVSIGLLCDQNLFVKFIRDKCVVINLDNTCIMEGNRSSDNCYLLAYHNTCLNTLVNDTKLWHRRLEHINYNSLKGTSQSSLRNP